MAYKSHHDHPHHVHDAAQVKCAVVTVSDTRQSDNDIGGDTVDKKLQNAGHRVISRHWVHDEVDAIRHLVLSLVENETIEAVVLTGGTGIAKRDVTPEAIVPLYAYDLPGFGETFRQLSFKQMGAHGLLSRATAGVIQQTLVFALPGSPDGVELAMDELVLPMLGHAIGLMQRDTLLQR